MTMITPSYLGETIEYSSLHACRSTLEDPTAQQTKHKVGKQQAFEAQGDRTRGRELLTHKWLTMTCLVLFGTLMEERLDIDSVSIAISIAYR